MWHNSIPSLYCQLDKLPEGCSMIVILNWLPFNDGNMKMNPNSVWSRYFIRLSEKVEKFKWYLTKFGQSLWSNGWYRTLFDWYLTPYLNWSLCILRYPLHSYYIGLKFRYHPHKPIQVLCDLQKFHRR